MSPAPTTAVAGHLPRDTSIAAAPLGKRVLVGIATGFAVPVVFAVLILFFLAAAGFTKPTREVGWDAWEGPPLFLPFTGIALCPLLLLVGLSELIFARSRRTAPIWICAGLASAVAGVAVTVGVHYAQAALAEHLYEREVQRIERAGRAWFAFEDAHGRAPRSVRELEREQDVDLSGLQLCREDANAKRGLTERDTLRLPLANWVSDGMYAELIFEPGPRESHPPGIWHYEFGPPDFLVAVERR